MGRTLEQSWLCCVSIAVEGQTDEKDSGAKEDIPTGWRQHANSGPYRTGIYGDSDKPLKDQWMYHAVADTILAHSLLRSHPRVDSENVGVMGISWGVLSYRLLLA